MPKPAPGPSLKWTGTSGDDVKIVSSLTELKNTLYDAGAGFDTLDLSALSSGISLALSQTTQGKNVSGHSQLWGDTAFHGSWWDFILHPFGAKVDDTIKGFEKVIGTGYNDYIEIVLSNVTRVVDGRAGDDSLSARGAGGSSTMIGGVGSDQFIGANVDYLLIGGTYDGAHATGDQTPDEFFLDGGTILDFEIGTDHLYIDGQSTTPWVNVSTIYGPAAQLTVTNGSQSDQIRLVGISAETMNLIPKGFCVVNTNAGAQITSGSGDDLFTDSASTTATTYIFSTNSGHDILTGLDLNVDTLVFPDAPTPSDISYHGDPALLLTFGGGQTLLLPELSTADLAQIHMQYPGGAQAFDLVGGGP